MKRKYKKHCGEAKIKEKKEKLTTLTCSRSSLYAAAQLLPAIKTRRCSPGSSTPAAALCHI